MKQAKRYDAVHLRYEDSNIRYGEGCEVEVVAGYDYDALKAVSGELLEALEELLSIGSVFISAIEANDPSVDFENWEDKARAVIAKARGEA